MKKISMFTAAMFFGLPLLAWAQHDHSQHGSGGHGAAAQPSGSQGQHARHMGHAMNRAQESTGEQKTCPVSGKPVKSDVSATVDGQTVKFCCPGCIDKYKEDSGKYAPALYKQIYPQRIQVKCPVMGGAPDPGVFVEHKGEKIHFCCKGCDAKFEKDPAKYAANLKKAYTEQVHCPVTGDTINSEFSLETRTGTVYFSSKECLDKYKADPDKYAAAALPAVGILAHGQTIKDDLVRCPVCPPSMVSKRGEVKSVIHDGKVYFLCTDGCEKSFKANPAKYLKTLAQNANTAQPQGCGHGCSH